MRPTKQERDMVKAIHEKELFDKIMPAVRAAIKAGGGADAILKKSEPLAAMRLIEATHSDKDEVRLKAATEILNRTIGRPVERSINIYGDIAKMNERDVDAQILSLMESTGAKGLLESTLGFKPKRNQKRKPRKSDPLVIDAEIIARPIEGAIPSAKAGTPADAPNKEVT